MPNGRSQRVDSATTAGADREEFRFDLPLTPFGDGGWYWFDIVAGPSGAMLEEATWVADVPADRADSGTVTIGITTMNRPDFCAKLLAQIGGDEDVHSVLDEVIVVEQGTKKVADDEHYPAAEESLRGKLRLIEQGNMGGSGGYARSQFETLEAGRSTYMMCMDDDVVCEPESIVRAVTFGDLCRKPTIVGGHMFSLYSKSRLHSFGEIINPYRFWWQSPPTVETDWDFAGRNLRSSRWLHRRIDVDFNGWFMCLIPTEVLREVGLSLPLFIKWDDSEFGVRASRGRLPDGDPARRRRLARAVDRQERRPGLAVLLPPAQPHDRGAAALALRARRPDRPGELQPPGQAPVLDAVLHRRAAPPRPRGRARRAGEAARRPAHEAARAPGQAQAVRRRADHARPRGLPGRTSREAAEEGPGPDPAQGAGRASSSPRPPARSGRPAGPRRSPSGTRRHGWPPWTPSGG